MKLSIISHPQFGEVRNTTIKGETWFVAKDVCEILGIRNNRDATISLDDDEKRDDVGNTDTIGRTQNMTMVNESGLYALIFQSRKSEAKAFRKWVTSEVLPAIRRQGFYVHPSATLTKKEISTIERVMVQNVNRYIIADDIRKCARKFGTQEYYIRHILNGRGINNDIMLDLQERAIVNRQNWSNAYSVERMKEITNKLTH